MSTFFKALERAEEERALRLRTAQAGPPSDQSQALSTSSRTGLEQLKLLFDYTKFHIRLYTILAIVFAVALAFEPAVFKLQRGLLELGVVFVWLAGMAAGIIGSRCAHFTSAGELWAAKIGPFRSNWLRGEHWSYVQHACLGMALGAAVLSVFLGSAQWPQGASLRTAVAYVATCWSHWPSSCSRP